MKNLDTSSRWKLPLLALACAAALALQGCGKPDPKDLVTSARQSLAKGDAATAIVELKSALQTKPDLADARFLLGQALLASGSAREAVIEIEKAIELKHPQGQALPLLAKAMLASGEFKKVTDRFAATSLEDRNAHAALKSAVARAYEAQGQPDRSEAATLAALELNSKYAAARLQLATLTARKGRFDESLRQLDALIADEPKDEEAWQLKGEVLWLGKQDFASGEAAIRKVLEINPKYMPGHKALIAMAAQRNDRTAFKARLADLRKQLPAHRVTRFFEAQDALADRNFKAARELTQELLKVAPDDTSVLQLAGAVELAAGAPNLAVTHLTKALQFEPGLTVARRLMGKVHMRAGQPAQALKVLQPLLERPSPAAEDLALAAQAHLANGQFSESEALFQQASKLNPDDSQIRASMWVARIAKGDVETGIAELDALAEKHPGTTADYALVSAYLAKNDSSKALVAAERLAKKQPKAALPHLLKGRIQLARKDFQAARASFELATTVEADFYPAIASLTALDTREGKEGDAIKRLERYLATAPRNYEALAALVELKQRTKAPPSAIKALLTEAVKSGSTEAAPHLMLVDWLIFERDLKGARLAAQEATTLVKDSPMLFDALGRVQLAAGDVTLAIGTFSTAVGLQPAAVLGHLRLAQAHSANKDPDAAERSLQRALAIDPKNIDAQRGLIQIALGRQRYADALGVARDMQKQRPKEAVGYVFEGEVHATQRKWARALEAHRAAFERQPSTATAIQVHALMLLNEQQAAADSFAKTWQKQFPNDLVFKSHLGTSALQAKDFALAESLNREVLSRNPDDVAALNNLAWAIVQQGKPGALEYAERANRLASDEPALMDTLAAALASAGQLPKAIEWQKRAIEKSGEPALAGYRLNLAKLHLQAGNRDAARAELDKLAYLGDKFARHAEVTELLRRLR